MKTILNFLTHGLGDLFSGFARTKGISEDGSTVSTGDGKEIISNGTAINWNTIVLFVLVGVGCYLIPSPFQSGYVSQPNQTSHNEVAIPGTPDTSYTHIPPITGTDTTITYGEVIPNDSFGLYVPKYVDNTVVINDKNLTGIIRGTAYPYIEEDTLKIDLPIEFNIEPKPMTQITQTDTLKITDSVWVPTPVPFMEKPIVVATVASIPWILVLIILL